MARQVFITGATSGIGLETARIFAKNGDNLIISGRREELLTKIKSELESAYGIEVLTLALDVRNREHIKASLAELLNLVGHIDILVNNAGLAKGLEPYQYSDFDDIEVMIDTNIKGAFFMARTILPSMVARNAGHIINLGSTAGIYAYAGGAVYCATKAAIKTLSDGMRIDVMATDVKITTIQPGIVETPFSEVRFNGDKEKADKVYDGIEALQPEDIAEVIFYVSNQPRRVQITDVTIMANQQGTGFLLHKEV